MVVTDLVTVPEMTLQFVQNLWSQISAVVSTGTHLDDLLLTCHVNRWRDTAFLSQQSPGFNLFRAYPRLQARLPTLQCFRTEFARLCKFTTAQAGSAVSLLQTFQYDSTMMQLLDIHYLPAPASPSFKTEFVNGREI